ncbi:MAG: DUF1461 domain-containing protein [Pseudomonadota bacterium]
MKKNRKYKTSYPKFNQSIIKPSHIFTEIITAVMMLMVSLGISWGILTATNFAYPFFYEKMEIQNFIDHFAALNEFGKEDFAKSSRNERITIFQHIVTEIHQKQTALSEISFKDSKNKSIPFLTSSEVTHLQDVAKLIRLFLATSIASFIGLILIQGIAHYGKWQLNLWRGAGLLLITIGTLLGGSLLIWGFKTVFYTLHAWIFPADHAWFFYYQESLMTTLMKAPDLFAAIGILWGVISLVTLVFILWIWKKISVKAFQTYF